MSAKNRNAGPNSGLVPLSAVQAADKAEREADYIRVTSK